MRGLLRAAALALPLVLAACAGSGFGERAIVTDPKTGKQRQENLREFTIADAKLSADYFAEHGDEIGRMCMQALADNLGEGSGIIAERQKGALLLFAQARTARKSLGSGAPEWLKIGCGPLFMDEVGDATRLAGRLGIRLVLPGLP